MGNQQEGVWIGGGGGGGGCKEELSGRGEK